MSARSTLVSATLAMLGGTAAAQDVQDVLREVSANMDANDLNCVSYTANGYVSLVGQTFDIRDDWPRLAVSSWVIALILKNPVYPSRAQDEFTAMA